MGRRGVTHEKWSSSNPRLLLLLAKLMGREVSAKPKGGLRCRYSRPVSLRTKGTLSADGVQAKDSLMSKLLLSNGG